MQDRKMSDESEGLEFDRLAMRDKIKLIRCTNKAQQRNDLCAYEVYSTCANISKYTNRPT